MKRALRIALIAVAGLLALGAVAVLGAAEFGRHKMQRRIELAVAPVPLPEDAASFARGRYLFMSRGCVECHGADGGGKVVIDDGGGMRVRAPNLTPGPGSAVGAYQAVDWVRTIRHGVKPDGRPAIIMPSEDYARLTDADMGALVAYLRQLPPAAGAGTELTLPLPVMALYGLGMIQDAAAKIDHSLPPPAPVPEAATAEHGGYVVRSCIGCHGPTLAGGRIPGGPPDWPPAADLTPSADGAMARYADSQTFAAMLRSGRRPDGSTVSPVMPFASLKALSDVDVQALYAYLKALPPEAAR